MLLDWAQNSLIVPPDLYNFTILFLLWEAIGIVRRNLFWPDNSRVIRRRPARRRRPITVSGAGHRCCTATWSFQGQNRQCSD
jgi:hypothetical protein